MTIHYRKITTNELKEEKQSLIAGLKTAKEYQERHGISQENIEEQKEGYITDELEVEKSFKLIYQHIENLREKLGKTPDEIIELELLENKYEKDLADLEAIPKNLGVPSKIDRLQSAISAKVSNMQSEGYDGGEVDESYDSVNKGYIELFEKSWINKKTFRFLNQQMQILTNGQKNISIFDVFDKSAIGQVFSRCTDLATSPLYDDMKEVKEDYYELQSGIQMKFKDKSVKFLVQLKEFHDIQKVSLNLPAYIEFSMVLPPFAHERKRHFKKGGNLEEFGEYLAKLGLQLEDVQKEYLKKLVEDGKLRLYHEKLENGDEKMVRAYFFNLTSMYAQQRHELQERFYQFFNSSKQIHVSRVLPHKKLPDWMKKIRGIIVEQINGDFVRFNKNRRKSEENQIQSNILDEPIFQPSEELANSTLVSGEWEEYYKAELRLSYKRNAQVFRRYAEALRSGKAKITCDCGCGDSHQERCIASVLEGVFNVINLFTNE